MPPSSWASCLLHAFLLLATTARADLRRPKHVVVVVADDLGWNDVGWRNPRIRTPTLDALAGAGVVLSNYYVHEVCSPTRGSILTGRYAYRLGYQGVISSSQAMGVPLSIPMLPELLRAADPSFVSAAVGKWHTGMFCDALLPTARGFDSFFGYLDGAESYTQHGNTMGFCGSNNNGGKGPFALDLWNGTAPARGWEGVYSSEMYSRVLRSIIEQHDASKPLFLYVALQNVHEPIDAPKAYQELYANTTNSSSRALFSADVSALDGAVANLTRSLQEKGLWNDTLLLFTSDNGANLHGGGNNWPLRGGKWSTWEGGIRANAFVVAGAAVPVPTAPPAQKGGQPKNLTMLMHCADVVPTVFGALGLELGPEHMREMDGVNMWPALSRALGGRAEEEGPAADARVIVHRMSSKATTSSAFSATIRVGDLKLHVGFPGDDKSAAAQNPPCVGGCWCPEPDPRSGVRTCERLDRSGSKVGRDPPSPQCAAACAAVPGCGALAKASRSACAKCLLPHNVSLAAAGCRVPPGGKDLRHWCNNLGPAPSPTAPTPRLGPRPGPRPGPTPGPTPMPCSAVPCLFNISSDPLEVVDLAPRMPDKVRELLAQARALQQKLLVSPFPGGHFDGPACAALNRTGMWGPWLEGNDTRSCSHVPPPGG